MSLPLDGAISRYLAEDAPQEVRAAIKGAKKGALITPGYPHAKRLRSKTYDKELAALQIELAKLQAWVRESGARIVAIFEGRDAAGKGGAIKRVAEYLNPRVARVVALSKPSDRERGEWYFQRYVSTLPTAGEIVLFDRSWYNRGVIEHVFGFCTPEERETFFAQVNEFEAMLTASGITLRKFWLNVGRAEQLRRFLDRENDPLRQWKLSPIDVGGLPKWAEYSDAIGETLARTHSAHAPWSVIRSDDKRRARLSAIRLILGDIPYAHRDAAAIGAIDAAITGGPDLLDG